LEVDNGNILESICMQFVAYRSKTR